MSFYIYSDHDRVPHKKQHEYWGVRIYYFMSFNIVTDLLAISASHTRDGNIYKYFTLGFLLPELQGVWK